jgi:hypothetical protein
MEGGEPGDDVQRGSGTISATFPNPGIRDAADPWVIAEAKIRRLVEPDLALHHL